MELYMVTPGAGLVAFVIYFLPTLIAMIRGHHDAFAIFLTNFLLGLTGLGWLFAFIWSFTGVRRRVRD